MLLVVYHSSVLSLVASADVRIMLLVEHAMLVIMIIMASLTVKVSLTGLSMR